MNTPTSTHTADFPLAGAPALENGTKFLYAAGRMQTQALKGLLRYQIETLAFLQRRYHQDMKLLDDLVATQKTHDAFDVVSDFWQNALSDYTDEAGKVASLGYKLASGSVRAVQKEAEAAIGGTAAKTAA
jgi:hypothetical protein